MDYILQLMTDPAVWASFIALAALEIVLGIDNVIFISIIANRLPEHQRAKARYIGLAGALVLRILLLASIVWIMKLTAPIWPASGFDFSWRDLILFAGGLFLIYKATHEIHAEMAHEDDRPAAGVKSATFASVVTQIMIVDMVFSLDSVITAVGLADHLPVMIAAVILAVIMMAVAATPVANFVERHPTTKMLALAFLVMIGMALMADGFGVHFERGYIYAAMGFSVLVEMLNLARAKRARARSE